MDVNRVLRNLVDAGDAILGANKSLRAMEDERAKVVVLASTCSKANRDRVEALSKDRGIPIYEYPGGADELGPAVGKPFLIGTLAITAFSDPDASALARQGRVAEEL